MDRGILKGYMTDLVTARKYGPPLTGNARRGVLQAQAHPPHDNTMIAPGTMRPEDIVRSVQRGLFVKKMGGGQVNTVTGDFVFNVAEGTSSTAGVGEAVRGATLIGNGPRILAAIEMVAATWARIGTVGKDGQGVPGRGRTTHAAHPGDHSRGGDPR